MLELNDCSSSSDEPRKCLKCALGNDEYNRRVEEGMKKFGFFIHAISDDTSHPFGVNYHTHGLPESFDHLNFQICFPLNFQTAYDIFHNLVNNIRKHGIKYIPGQIVPDIIDPFNITFLPITEDDELLLRIIFPDEKGILTKNEINPKYIDQWNQ